MSKKQKRKIKALKRQVKHLRVNLERATDHEHLWGAPETQGSFIGRTACIVPGCCAKRP